MSGPDGRRAIAARNAEAILEAALQVLGEDREAGIAEVAAVAGVGRATVYRHFASREVLVGRLREQAAEQLRGVAEEVLLVGERDLRAGLVAFVAGLSALAERYAALSPQSPRELDAAVEAAYAPVAVLLRRAQADGRLDASVSVPWAVAALRGLLLAARREREAGRLGRTSSPALVVDTLLEGLTAAPHAVGAPSRSAVVGSRGG